MTPEFEIVFPAYNEEKRLSQSNVLEVYHDYLTRKFGNRFKIWVVINGTTDHTEEILAGISKRYPDIFYVNIPEKGKGAAFREALRHLSAPLFAFVDLDGAIFPDQLDRLFSEIKDKEIVIGSRKCKGAKLLVRPPWYRRWNSFFARLFVRLFLGLPVQDPFCGFKMYRRESLIRLQPFLTLQTAMIDVNILYAAQQQGMKIKEVPIEWRHVAGSKVSLLKSDWKNFKEVLKIKYRYLK